MAETVLIGGKQYPIVETGAYRDELLRGEFAMVEHGDPEHAEVSLVLLGYTPENRKLVYRIPPSKHGIPRDLDGGYLVQDSPGMARSSE